ncbi:MAG: hypothetical protein Q4E76_04085 [Tissierellia bacterium]|nr:hypothetical protein [Tissierellia bacterium]
MKKSTEGFVRPKFKPEDFNPKLYGGKTLEEFLAEGKLVSEYGNIYYKNGHIACPVCGDTVDSYDICNCGWMNSGDEAEDVPLDEVDDHNGITYREALENFRRTGYVFIESPY